MLLTPTGDIVPQLMVGVKFMAVLEWVVVVWVAVVFAFFGQHAVPVYASTQALCFFDTTPVYALSALPIFFFVGHTEHN